MCVVCVSIDIRSLHGAFQWANLIAHNRAYTNDERPSRTWLAGGQNTHTHNAMKNTCNINSNLMCELSRLNKR